MHARLAGLASARACTPRMHASHPHVHAHLASPRACMHARAWCTHVHGARTCMVHACTPRIRMCMHTAHPHSCRLFGPFRQMWTLPFEAFLQILKGFCEKGNWKTVPWTVATKWAQRRAFSFATHDSSAALQLDVESSSEIMCGDALSRALSASPLLTHVLTRSTDHAQITSARHLSFISRDGVEVRIGDWLLVASGSKRVVLRVHEMAELCSPECSKLRLWGEQSRSLDGVLESSDGMIHLDKTMRMTAQLVRLELVSIMQILCVDRGAHLEYRYLF